jgi:hypothetical protein
VEDVPKLRDAVKWVQDSGESLSDMIRTFANYRALQVEKRSLDRQFLNLAEQARSMDKSNSYLREKLDANSLSLSILDELTMLGFDYKELKKLTTLVLQINKANGISSGDGLAVKKFFTDIEEDYDDVLGFKTSREKMRKELKQLSLKLKMEQNVFEAIPYVNSSLGSLIMKGVREDQIVKISELLESYPDFISLYLDSSDRGLNAEGRSTKASISSSTISTSSPPFAVGSKQAQDVVVSEADYAEFKDPNKAEYSPSETGAAPKKINANEEVETGILTDSQDVETTPKGTLLEGSKRSPLNQQSARHRVVAKRSRELAIVSVTSSGFIAGHPPSSVIDNNTSASWIGKKSSDWIQLDLGSIKNIHRLSIGWSPHSSRPISYTISVSDDEISFTEKKIGSNDDAYPTFWMDTLPPHTYGRYVRIINNGTTGDDRFGISGIALFGSELT